MIKIYCLVDPRNNKPFYVGATKVILKYRLSAHIHAATTFKTNEHAIKYTGYKKHYLIQDLIHLGMKPRIDLLYISRLCAVEYYEAFFYKMLVVQGFELFNWTHQFNYLKYTKVPYYNFGNESQVRPNQ